MRIHDLLLATHYWLLAMKESMIIYLNTDGGSRGNPGPAACGAVIYDEDGQEMKRLKRSIGNTTNNQAEYQALAMALDYVKETYGTAKVNARLDSELVVKQLNGEYKMKNAELRPWFERVKTLQKDLGNVTFEHVRREQNKVADMLVNECLDELTA